MSDIIYNSRNYNGVLNPLKKNYALFITKRLKKYLRPKKKCKHFIFNTPLQAKI